MTPAEALAIAATIGKRLRDPAELEAFRMAYAVLKNPLEAQIEALQKVRPGSRVSVQRLEDDPEFGPWCAWITWRDVRPHEFAELGKTPQDAITKLREAFERAATPKTPCGVCRQEPCNCYPFR